jgi:hypothetical protein
VRDETTPWDWETRVLYAVIDSALADRMAEVANRLREERRGCAISREGTAESRWQSTKEGEGDGEKF